MPDPVHIPVMLDEVLGVLAPKPGEVVVDCTLGRGGHAEALARAVGPHGLVVGFEFDPENLAAAGARVEATGVPFIGCRESFLRLPARLPAEGRRASIILADLGVSSPQLDDARRGFSFDRDGPLDMRLDPDSPVTAERLVNTLDEAELTRIIRDYGEEPLAWKIARKVVRARMEEPIKRTARFAELVREAYGGRARTSRMHPATRTFMALRIAVNDELAALEGLLDSIGRAARATDRGGWIEFGARVAIISFHSLEDRIVKRAFVDLERSGWGRRITKRPLRAEPGEVERNPRARSAKLRAAVVARSEERDATMDGTPL